VQSSHPVTKTHARCRAQDPRYRTCHGFTGAREAALRGHLCRAGARQGRSTLKSATCRWPAAFAHDYCRRCALAEQPRSSAGSGPAAYRPSSVPHGRPHGGGGGRCTLVRCSPECSTATNTKDILNHQIIQLCITSRSTPTAGRSITMTTERAVH
jgi:hypothetical protein